MFSDAQLERYSRNIIVKEIGGEGQRKLFAAKVLVIGAGGLGSPLLYYLAAAGVGTIGIVDNDTVELSNLQRQILHTTLTIGQPKSSSAEAALHALNPDIILQPHNIRLSADNAEALLRCYDIIADGSDNATTRILINAWCHKLKKPLISAAIRGLEGQISTFKSYEKNLPCYRCLYPDPPGDAELSCTASGVLGAVAGVMGSLQAMEVVKEILQTGEGLAGYLLCYSGHTSSFRKIRLLADPECPVCGKSS